MSTTGVKTLSEVVKELKERLGDQQAAFDEDIKVFQQTVLDEYGRSASSDDVAKFTKEKPALMAKIFHTNKDTQFVIGLLNGIVAASNPAQVPANPAQTRIPHLDKLDQFVAPSGWTNASFAFLRTQRVWLDDKSRFLRIFENGFSSTEPFPTFVIFRRPTRQGKSTFLKMLSAFYDIKTTPSMFDMIFGSLDIGNNPPKQKYLILLFDFTLTTKGTYNQAMIEEVFRGGMVDFIKRYTNILGPDSAKILETSTVASMRNLLLAVRQVGQQIFLLVDEVDAGSSWIVTELATYSGKDFGRRELESAKTILSMCKSGNYEDVIGRAYATGITTLSLRDILSGAGWVDVSCREELSDMLGITPERFCDTMRHFSDDNSWALKLPERNQEHAQTLTLSRPTGPGWNITRQHALSMVKTQNGYRFSPKGVSVMNTTLTCRLMGQLLKKSDDNYYIDTSDILPGHILLIMQYENIVDFVSKILYEQRYPAPAGMTAPILAPELLIRDSDTIAKFLFSIGFLTFEAGGTNQLCIPNQQAHTMLSRFLVEARSETKKGIDRLKEVLTALSHGKPDQFCQYMEDSGFAVFDCIRDSTKANELTFKAIIATYISSLGYYLLRSEKPVAGGFIDLFGELDSCKRALADTYDLLAEIKRLKMEVLVSKSGVPFSYDLLSELTPEELKDSVYIRFSIVQELLGRYEDLVSAEGGENDNEDEEMLDSMNDGEDDNGDEDRDEMDDEDRDEMDDEDRDEMDNEAGATKFIQLKYFHEVAALQAGFYAKRVKLAQQMRLKAFVFISLGWARISWSEVDLTTAPNREVVAKITRDVEAAVILIQKKKRVFEVAEICGHKVPLPGTAKLGQREVRAAVYLSTLLQLQGEESPTDDDIWDVYVPLRAQYSLKEPNGRARMSNHIRAYETLLDDTCPGWRKWNLG